MSESRGYYKEVEQLEEALRKKSPNQSDLVHLQSQLDGLMFRYRNDLSLGSDRYALYQLQAIMSMRREEYAKAKRYIDYAVKIKGSGYKFADQFSKRLYELNATFSPKNTSIWKWLIVAPLLALAFVAVLQFIAALTVDKTGASADTIVTLINIFSVLIGVLSVIIFLLFPIWLIEMNAAKKYNETRGLGVGLRKKTGVFIAVFFGLWFWAYTHKVHKGRFWLNFILGLTAYWQLISWPWSIIDALRHTDEFYELYPYHESA